MKLQNNGGSIDLGRNDIFAKGEIREFDQETASSLIKRYRVSEVQEKPKVEKKEAVKDSLLKKTIKKLKK